MGFKDEYGNSLINEEQKIRISISESALVTISEDMDVFGISRTATFINIVFSNFWKEAKSSISLYLLQRELELSALFANAGLDDNSKRLAINQLLRVEKQNILEEITKFKGLRATSKLYHINDDNIKILVEDCDEEKFYSRPGQYIRSIIEEYCSLPFIKREQIFRKQIYDTIEEACSKRRILKIKANYNGQIQLFYVYPYKIVPDSFHTQSYLVCYSHKEGEDEKNKIVASFSMARINPPTMLGKTFYLNKKEIHYIEDCITNYSPAYLIGKPELISVKLTERGKRSYQSRLYSRPEKIEQLSSDNIYVFECTQQQIFNYFFPFGVEAEIISPIELRNRFMNTHEKAITLYLSKEHNN